MLQGDMTIEQMETEHVPESESIIFTEFKRVKGELRRYLQENAELRRWTQHLQEQIDELKKNPNVNSLNNNKMLLHPHEKEYTTDEEDLARETEWIRVKHKTKKRKMNTSTSPPSKSPHNEVAQPEKPKRVQVPPPIMVEKVDSYEELYSMITKELNANQFQVKLINGNSAKLNTIDSDSYRSIVKILSSEKQTFHTYENKQSRPIRVKIKNIHNTCKPESIVANLKEQGFNVISATNKKSFKTKAALNMYMVSFENNENIDKIYKISHILGCKVDVQAIKASKLIPQCKNCQAFGHTKTYCSRLSRCVKCAGKHVSTECNKTKEAVAKCVNCGGSHPASYRGCIVAKELQAIRNKKVSKSNQNTVTNDNEVIARTSNQQQRSAEPRTEDNISYASVTAGKNLQAIPQASNTLSNSIHLILEKITSMETKITAINEKVRTLESRANRSAFSARQ